MAVDWTVTVQNLLNKAAGTKGPESEAFYEKAMYLMTKYGIEDAQLRKRDGKIEKATYEIMLIGAPYTAHKADLLAIVANFLGGQIISKQGSNGSKLWLFGFKEDIARIKMLYFSLLAQLHLEITVAIIPQGENARRFREAFHFAFNQVVEKRFQDIQNRVKAEPGNSLVLRDIKKQVEDSINAMFEEVVPTNPRQITLSSSAGVAAGISAGQKADLGQTRLRQ